MKPVENHFLRFLLPFTFAPAAAGPVDLNAVRDLLVTPLPQSSQTFSSSERRAWEDEALTSGRIWGYFEAGDWCKFTEFLLPFFRHFLDPGGGAPACLGLAVPDGLRQRLLGSGFFEVWNRGRQVGGRGVRFTHLWLMLFNTGVGFLVVELQADSNGLDTKVLAELAWHLRNLGEGASLDLTADRCAWPTQRSFQPCLRRPSINPAVAPDYTPPPRTRCGIPTSRI